MIHHFPDYGGHEFYILTKGFSKDKKIGREVESESIY